MQAHIFSTRCHDITYIEALEASDISLSGVTRFHFGERHYARRKARVFAGLIWRGAALLAFSFLSGFAPPSFRFILYMRALR